MGRVGQRQGLEAGLYHGVAARSPAPAMLCEAGGYPRHWELYSMILFLLLSCATTRDIPVQPQHPRETRVAKTLQHGSLCLIP